MHVHESRHLGPPRFGGLDRPPSPAWTHRSFDRRPRAEGARTIGRIDAIGTQRPAASPVLVGRDDLLDLAARRLESARAGSGELLLFAGEAGIGKTRLLGVVRRRAAQAGFLVAVGAASPYDRDIVGGILLALGRSLIAEARTRPVGERMLQLLSSAGGDGADTRPRGRRLALSLADALCEASSSGPTLLVLEDLHWVDDLSLEVIDRVARRATSLPLLVCASYRSEEVGEHSRLREWRALLLGQRQAEEARLRRLSEDETRTVLASILGSDAPLIALAAAVHGRSDGIPLHVEELLAALRSRPTLDVIEMPVPETVGAAVLERAQHLSPAALDIARKSSVIGRGFGVELLEAIADLSTSELDGALAELYERQFMLRDPGPGSLHFRHGLICDAIYEVIPRGERQRLHARVAAVAAAREGNADASYVATQFDRAGDRANAFRWAQRAARSAAALSAHRAADAAYRIAVRNSADVPASERAALLAAHAAEAAAIDDSETAAHAYVEARAILSATGERVAAAELAAPLAAARHLLGADLDERRTLLHSALAEIDGESGEDAQRARARLRAALAAAYMLDRRLDDGEAAGRDALRDARETRDVATEVNAQVTVGAVEVFAGQMDSGWAMLEEGIATARARGLEEEAARAYRMIGSSASVLVEYERAERFLSDGIAYAQQVDLWNHRHYMAAHLAHVLWATGRWTEAAAHTDRVLADGRGGITTRITALHVAGYLALGRGQFARARETLTEARGLAERMGELQRLLPALWGLAELALLEGDAARAAELADLAKTASDRVADAAYLFPFALTGTRAHLALDDVTGAAEWARSVGELVRKRAIPGTLPAVDHANALVLAAQGSTGRARELLIASRGAWLARGRQWEATWAAIDLARCELRAGRVDPALAIAREASAAASAIGAAPLALLADDLMRTASGRGGLVETWAPLTAREFDVATRVTAGLTNAQIAAELRIAPRTVATHVEHILSKLGASRRSEIAAWAAALKAEGRSAERR